MRAPGLALLLAAALLTSPRASAQQQRRGQRGPVGSLPLPGVLDAPLPEAPGDVEELLAIERLSTSARGRLSGTAAAASGAPPDKVVVGEFMVALQDSATDSDVDDVARRVTGRSGVLRTLHRGVARGGFRGLSYKGPDSPERQAQLIDELLSVPAVAAVEPVRIFRAEQQQQQQQQQQPPPPGGQQQQQQQQQRPRTSVSTQNAAPWGLASIDGRPRDGSYSYTSTGGNVCVYVVDTGVRSTHTELRGRVLDGWFHKYGPDDPADSEDGFGHGTHSAGVVAGTTYGVAKRARVVPVRVLNATGWGREDVLVAGLNAVIADDRRCPRRVVSMSISSERSDIIDRAVQAAAASNISVVSSAGNQAGDACARSPAGAKQSVTVAAIDWRSKRLNMSNYGDCVDLFAPGFNIISAWSQNDFDWRIINGTSSSAPHVAGLLARLWGSSACNSPQTCYSALIGYAIQGVVKNPKQSPNRLASMPAWA